ncbi:hypothetical protein [Thermomonospora umbrina]|uniref:Uncharacterized protein n=1 Tax=Thermomonospora umbrina TaxID=111806 RepID=A0A3D9SNV2_9ACTN|nr:hypothetical protein [Thermomonospora umbrina]REE97297.1 hypothetical protein DFJ69_2763 [Thermomonospora umbrina]
MGESTGWTGPDGLRVTVVPLSGAHRVTAAALGSPLPDDLAYAFLVTREGAIVDRGYYPTVESLADVVDLSRLEPV